VITVLTCLINYFKLFSLLAAIQETLGRQINLVNEKYRAVKMTSDSEMSGKEIMGLLIVED
jgi:hypothetical protein